MGVIEIVGGILLLAGLATRLAAVPLIINMGVAVVSTKIPILLGHSFWGFDLRELSAYGFWSMAHEVRTDFAMLLGSIYPADRRSRALVARRRDREEEATVIRTTEQGRGSAPALSSLLIYRPCQTPVM